MKARKILTIDDSRTIRALVTSVLEQEGYQVIAAEDGVLGVEEVSAETPDLIITDINMPRLDGFGVIEKVRAMPASEFIPILVLTTESDACLKQRARAAGATGWITKPFDDHALLGAVERVLAG